jgi:ribonucrease Y
VLLDQVAQETRQDMARVIREEEVRAREEADERAREIVSTAIQRLASDQVAELTTKTLEIPNDELKGRIIGRGGRNIRVFEQKAAVDVIVDDTPELITISSFNPIRREIAARAMHYLVADGRIHPARIEKVLEKATEGSRSGDARAGGARGLRRRGPEPASRDHEAPGAPLLPDQLWSEPAACMPSRWRSCPACWQLRWGAIRRLPGWADCLHDIGKAVDFEVEGTHATIGAELARRYGVPKAVINCIESHHHEADQQSLEAVLVEAADAISGARPERAGRAWSTTSSASGAWRRSRAPSTASRNPTRFRRVVRSVSSSARARSMTWTHSSSRARWRGRSRRRWSIPVRSR